MKLKDFKKKELSEAELQALIDEIAQVMKYRAEPEKTLLGGPYAKLLGYIKHLLGELEKFKNPSLNFEENFMKKQDKPVPVGGPVKNPMPKVELVDSDYGKRVWYAFQENTVDQLIKWGREKNRDKLVEIANEWATKHSKDLVF